MACTRGCVGVGICEGNICCIQFQHDCGSDCVGVVSGFSRLQINAAGVLEICSNVAGVCTCEPMLTGTDVLVDNLDGTVTHTALDGAPKTLDICQILVDGGCILHLSPGVTIGTVILPAVIPAGAVYILVEPATFVSITNTSTETMSCIMDVSGTQINATNTGGVAHDDVQLQYETTVDGGGSWQALSGSQIRFLSDTPGTPGSFGEISTTPTTSRKFVLSGAGESFGVRRSYRSITGFTGVVAVDTTTLRLDCLAVPA